ncbi:uncharacterized protein BP01DRAFT_394485 [Aspergillus saccharolyticus JOP 1030-1]|uniref:Uncharacterized protein n=1 Tax=Aspergillus saccharolyticus JOP 1030-1 TaxID=1450539 RepID=A0A318Z6N4_9EURO|nr:hypothetical protein BP01DRAFT_394485 [Aspergillus saccharolyticus JOP 1030-1]PYH42094.1 hypothetical protein BP01DRAFT_394485 [Aspergillus saccharolyticus JOP 1030-1]
MSASYDPDDEITVADPADWHCGPFWYECLVDLFPAEEGFTVTQEHTLSSLGESYDRLSVSTPLPRTYHGPQDTSGFEFEDTVVFTLIKGRLNRPFAYPDHHDRMLRDFVAARYRLPILFPRDNSNGAIPIIGAVVVPVMQSLQFYTWEFQLAGIAPVRMGYLLTSPTQRAMAMETLRGVGARVRDLVVSLGVAQYSNSEEEVEEATTITTRIRRLVND